MTRFSTTRFFSAMRPSVMPAVMLSVTVALAGGLLACGDGVSTEDAQATCNEERTRVNSAAAGNCVSDASYAQCVSCQEECGDACATLDTVCPTEFSCPEGD